MNLKLNETPVRTARNFNINNIKLNDIDFPKKVQEFKNTQINGIDSKVDISHTIEKYNIKYGVGKKAIEEVQDNANQKLKIVIKENTNIEIKNCLDRENTSLIDNIEVIANENVHANVAIKYKSENDALHYHNGVIRVFAKANSKINITIVNLLNNYTNNFLSIENNLEESSNINYTIVDFGGKNSITNYYSDISRK